MNGGLSVKDTKSNSYFKTNKEIFEIRNVNLYSDEYFSPNSSITREKLIKELLNDYLTRKK